MLYRTDFESLHNSSSKHRVLLAGAVHLGCFYCRAIFSPSEIVEWCDSPDPECTRPDTGVTALCPHCGIDAVLPETAAIAITPALLEAMHTYWFAGGS